MSPDDSTQRLRSRIRSIMNDYSRSQGGMNNLENRVARLEGRIDSLENRGSAAPGSRLSLTVSQKLFWQVGIAVGLLNVYIFLKQQFQIDLFASFLLLLMVANRRIMEEGMLAVIWPWLTACFILSIANLHMGRYRSDKILGIATRSTLAASGLGVVIFALIIAFFTPPL